MEVIRFLTCVYFCYTTWSPQTLLNDVKNKYFLTQSTLAARELPDYRHK